MLGFRSLVIFCCCGFFIWGIWGCTPGKQTFEGDILKPTAQWQIISTEDVSLEMPPGYVGGEPGRLLPEMQATLAAWGLGDRNEWLAQNAEKIDLLAFQNQTDSLRTINVVSEKRPESSTLIDYLEGQTQKLQAANLTAEFVLLPADIGQMQIEVKNLQQRIYVIPEDEYFWSITFSGSKLDRDQSEIDRTVQSFRILP